MTQRVLTLTMPVISTAHIPRPDSIEDSGYLYAAYDCGWFFFVDDQPDLDDKWVCDLRTWLDNNGFAGDNWVRLDADGDRLDGLPLYTWE